MAARISIHHEAAQSLALALVQSSNAPIVLLDGDLQNDPRDIPRLLAEIEKGADLVCGYRAKRRDTAKPLASRATPHRRSR